MIMDSTFEIKHCETSSLSQVDFDDIAFGKVFSDHIFVMDYKDGKWD